MNVDATMALIAEQAFQLFLLKEKVKEVERINRHLSMQNTELEEETKKQTDEVKFLKENSSVIVNSFDKLNNEIEELKSENQNLTNALFDAMDWIKETQKERQVKEKCETSKKLTKETAANSLDTSTVNRVEVIDSNGRVYVNRNAKNVVVKRQDDFRTLKVFLT